MNFNPQPRRRKGPGRRQKDCDRAAAHRARLASADTNPQITAATADPSTSIPTAVSAETPLIPPPHLPAASAGCSTPPPTPAASAGHTPPSVPAGVSPQTVPAEVAASSVPEAMTEIADEVCTDLEYDIETADEFTVVNATSLLKNSPFSKMGWRSFYAVRNILRRT